MKNKNVFLGGTCNNSAWRDRLIPLLKINYFNPIVKDWTPECQANEIKERENATIVLYVITPKMTGVYSIAEAVQDSNKHPEKTIFVSIDDDNTDDKNILTFTTFQLKSLIQVGKLIQTNGGKYIALHSFNDLPIVANILNNF